MKAIRLLFDAVPDGSAGTNHLYQALVRAIGRTRPEDGELTVLVRHDQDKSLQENGVRLVRLTLPRGGWLGRFLWYKKRLPDLVQALGANVIYSFSGILSKTLVKRCGTITTVNNMLPFTPRSMEKCGRLSKEQLRLFLLHHLYIRSVKLADKVLLHSKYALDMISPYVVGLDAKATVVHSGIPSSLNFKVDVPPPHPYEGRPYLFYLSAVHPYKNHETLIHAYSKAHRRQVGMPELLMAGFPSDSATVRSIETQILKLGLEGHVRYLGPLPRADIAAWLHHATINVFPSSCETNSLILAETLGCHGVLACANAASMPEIVGDAAMLFDPYDAEALAQLLITLTADAEKRKMLQKLAALRKNDFSWDACGVAIWEAARRAADAYTTRAGVPL
ncbi:glycosyltransferase family 4 protein [bacterium]|nr:glycosyltransferase family 4 protein [bacterium]